ncbi:MAG: HEAT repeat domain-containing protein, partial [Planctomycetota bacterium]
MIPSRVTSIPRGENPQSSSGTSGFSKGGSYTSVEQVSGGRRGSAAKSAVSALLKLLDDPVSYVSTEVRLTLRRVGGSNPNALVKGLKSKNVEIRRGVAQVLDWNWAPPRGAPGSPPRLPIKKLDALVAALDDPDEQVRKHMASALVTYGERAIPALVKALDSPKIHLRTAAATALGNMPKELALADLLGALRSRKAGTRAAAAYGLRFPKKSAHKIVPPVHRVLDDKEPQVRAAAAETLGLLGGYADVVVPSLVRHLDDADESVRAACLHACVRYGKDAVGPLMRALKTEERPAALVALPRIGWPAVAALTGALGDPDSRYRADCAECLGGIGSPADSAAPDLQRLLEDEYPYVRAAAAVGLGGIGPGAWKAAAGLTTTLEDKDAGVRASSAQALGRVGVGAKSVVTGLGKSLQDPQAKVRVASAFALWRLGEDHTAALKMLRSVVGDKAAPLPLRVQAAGVLRTMRWDAREAIPELAACFVVDGETADPPELRAVAAHALGEIASASGVGLVERPDRWGRERNKIVRATVDLGLEWLAAHQDLTGETLRGFWDADEFMKHDPAQDKCDGPGKALYDPGVTSLAVLSFLGLGYTDRGEANPYAKNVDGGLSYLMSI